MRAASCDNGVTGIAKNASVSRRTPFAPGIPRSTKPCTFHGLSRSPATRCVPSIRSWYRPGTSKRQRGDFLGHDRQLHTIWRTKWHMKIRPKVSSGLILRSPARTREMPSGSVWQTCSAGLLLAHGCEKRQAPQIKEMNHIATGDRTPKANLPRTLKISGPMAPNAVAPMPVRDLFRDSTTLRA
jgi:hypothetical protein